MRTTVKYIPIVVKIRVHCGEAEAMNNFAVLLYCEIANSKAYDEERVKEPPADRLRAAEHRELRRPRRLQARRKDSPMAVTAGKDVKCENASPDSIAAS